MSSTEANLAVRSQPAKTSERRLYRRYAAGLEAWLECDGERLPCQITDISLGGAAVTPGLPAWNGRRVRLGCDLFRHGPGLPGSIISNGPAVGHISFELDGVAEDALTMFLVARPTKRPKPQRATD